MSLSIMGIHHIAIIVSDYATSKDFYTRILGGVVINETFREARNSWKLDLAMADGVQLELFTFDDAPKRPSYPEAQGLRHLSFRVADIDAARSVLVCQGIPVEPIRQDELTQKRFMFFQDPDGLPLELYEA